ncbi:MAG TPA: Gfo/Idh/MocA family oxidoreductase [Pirellulales bacterium]
MVTGSLISTRQARVPRRRRRSAGEMPQVAVIGLGYWGPNLVRNFHTRPGCRLKACCDVDGRRLDAVRADYPTVDLCDDSGEILADPQINGVVIATPVETHYWLAKAALLAGKAVLIEKPLTADVAQAEELVALADERGLTLMVDHTFIYSPAVAKIKQLFDGGELGELLFIDSVRINLGLIQPDVNVVWDLAPHDLSIVDYLLGRLPRSVSASGAAHAGRLQEDVAYLNLDFGGGLIANFHVNWLSPVKLRYTMFGGSRKSVVYNDLETAEKVKVYDRGVDVRGDDPDSRRQRLVDYRTGDVWSPHLSRDEPLARVADQFIECMARGVRPPSDGQAGLRIVRILDAAQRSLRAQGARVAL